jgi:hypothetical protein
VRALARRVKSRDAAPGGTHTPALPRVRRRRRSSSTIVESSGQRGAHRLLLPGWAARAGGAPRVHHRGPQTLRAIRRRSPIMARPPVWHGDDALVTV